MKTIIAGACLLLSLLLNSFGAIAQQQEVAAILGSNVASDQFGTSRLVADPEKNFRLLPQPQRVEWLKGKGLAANKLRNILLKGINKKPVMYGELESLPLSSNAGAGILQLILSDRANLPSSPEGYILEVNNDQAIITARTSSGLFYGSQTLRQLLEDAHDQQIDIPACKITDYPDLAYRAIHLDLKHHLEAGHYYYELIDRLAQVKVNAIIIEFEDKLRYRKAPVVGSSNAISVEEFAAISRYAQGRNIEISPLIQGLGHASFILKHEEYKKLRDNPESDWVFDPLHPGTYDLQFALYDDAIAATPGGKYLHVGGDEVGTLGVSELSKKSGKKPFELQMYWLKKVCEYAREHDRIPIFWDDMVFSLSGLYETTYTDTMPEAEVKATWQVNEHRLNENIHLFPQNCIFMRWNYGMQILGNQKAIDWYTSHHIKVMAATAAQTMWPMLPRENSNFYQIKDYCRITAQKKMEGILCTAWDDTSPHHETIWRGLYIFGSLSWNYEDIPADKLNLIFRHRFFSPALSDIAFEFQNMLEQALQFWETALVDKGNRSNYPYTMDLIELPDAEKPGSWSSAYSSRIDQSEKEVARYLIIKEKIERSKQLSRRNHYTLEVMEQINEFQVYPAKLLLLLNKYDNTSSAENKKAAKINLQQYVSAFHTIRKEMENVYSSSRTLDKPADYLQDKNYHRHLANGTINSDWMFVYELAINKEIEKMIEGDR